MLTVIASCLVTLTSVLIGASFILTARLAKIYYNFVDLSVCLMFQIHLNVIWSTKYLSKLDPLMAIISKLDYDIAHFCFGPCGNTGSLQVVFSVKQLV